MVRLARHSPRGPAFYKDLNRSRKSALDFVQGHEWMRKWRGTGRGARERAEELKKQGEETGDKVRSSRLKLRAQNTPEHRINKKIAAAARGQHRYRPGAQKK